MKNQLSKEAIEFQPSAQEIKEEQLPGILRYSVYASLALVIFTVAVGFWYQVDIIVNAPGKLIYDTPNIIMRPLERSVIKEINVKIGEIVKKNQILVTFDQEINQAEIERLNNEIKNLTAQFERLMAEFNGRDYTPANQTTEMAMQLQIFKERQNYFKEKIRYFDYSLKQLDAAQKGTEDNLAIQQQRLKASREIEKMFVELHQKEAGSLKEMLQYSIDRMQLEAEVDKLKNSLLENSHQIQSTIASKNSFVEEWRNSVAEELVKIHKELIANTKSLQKEENTNSYVYLRAPCDAIVHEVANFSRGSAVREAESLITLVPLAGKIELEAEVLPQDIAKVAVGSPARIKLSSFPFQKYGTLEGTVRTVSEDTFQNNREYPSMSGAKSYYQLRISVGGQLKRVPANLKLTPGMEAVAEIKTGKRSIIEYLIYPLIKSLKDSAD